MAGALAQQFLSRFDQASPSHPAAMLAIEIASEAGMARIPALTWGSAYGSRSGRANNRHLGRTVEIEVHRVNTATATPAQILG